MSYDLTEQRLREQLHEAAEGQSDAYLDVDPLTALDTGHRVLRRRRVTAVAGTAAAALVLGVGSWAVLSNQTADERTLPAATSSPSLSGPATEIRLGAIPQTGRTEPLVAVVTVDEAQQRLGFTLQTEEGAVLASRETPQPREEQALWVTLVPGVTVATLPATATSALPTWVSGQTTAQGSAAGLSPDGRVLAAWWTDGSAVAAFTGIVWTDGEAAYTAGGQSLDSVVQDDVVFFVGGNEGYVGYLMPPVGSEQLGSGGATAAGDMQPGHFPAVWVEGATGSSGTYATYLPPVEDVELVTTGEARVRDLTVHDFGDIVGVLVLADVEGSRESVTEVRFTDPELGSTGGPAPAT